MKGCRGFRPYLDLCRPGVSLFSALSAAMGFFLASSYWDPRVAAIAAGVFLLACGSSAINQYQERERDGLMPRTQRRPLCSGRLQPLHALLFSAGLVIAGLSAVFLWGGQLPVVLGLFTLGWYNGVYTSLKGKTAFAIIPGALVGSLPPVIGWVSAGGKLLDTKVLFIMFFFFMWQVPHFWLFLLRYGKEYEEAGLPCLSSVFSKDQLVRIIFAWINAVAVSSLLIISSGLTNNYVVCCALLAVSFWLVWNGAKLLCGNTAENTGVLFNRINVYMLLVMVIVSGDKFMFRIPF